MYTIIAQVFSIAASTFAEVSVVIFLVHLMGVVAKRTHLIFLWMLCALLVVLNILAIIIVICFYVPPEARRDPNIKGKCIDYNFQIVVADIQSRSNALMDVLVAIFPVFLISKLNSNTKTKISFGAVATIIEIISIAKSHHADITWAWAPLTLWYTAEIRKYPRNINAQFPIPLNH
ncbi:hypothetical protein F4778DRAFT_784001 [Xylariomycetidae sp. FL2044]|nr:hypothetical protein F4778DRAFT_784001 [Xylariomycetidae sp. FL2044]